MVHRGAGRAEDGDRGADARQALEPLHELGHDLEYLPRLAAQRAVVDGRHAGVVGFVIVAHGAQLAIA